LLRRLREVMAPHGAVLVEVESPGATTSVQTVRVESMGATGPWFEWARVSIDDVDAIAAQARFERTWTYEEEGRWFVQLTL
ncbi:MAG: SAM-dependent methyltransferase, partial [Ilumatobacteraceae bacterium]